jgi:dTDP-4-amino-4,6-dideoxygalactose transaminase
MSDSVPFLDLAAHHDEMRCELDQVWADVTAKNAFIGGEYVARFEAEYASYCGVDHCIGVGNGTDALELVMRALGIGPGDEVIVPANTFVATVEPILTVGAIPVFVDVDPRTLLMTADAVEAALTSRTVAVAAVHLYGQTPDMDALEKIATREGIALIEDAAQAHGARWGEARAGSFGTAATFSFYPGKNLGAFGDGGAITTNDPALTEAIRTLANHGRDAGTHHLHVVSGFNSRLDGLQAGVLSVKLRSLEDAQRRRRAAHAAYEERLRDVACTLVDVEDDATAVHHLEVIRVADRARLIQEFNSRRIGWGLHYPIPCHRQGAFAEFATAPLPVVEQSAEEILSIPMFPTITETQIDLVCDAIRSAKDGV